MERAPRQGSFDDLPVQAAVDLGWADDEGRCGADVVQGCLRAIGIDHGHGCFAFHAGLQGGRVELLLGGDGEDAFAAQAVLLVEQGGIQVPVAVLFTRTACCCGCRQGMGVEGVEEGLCGQSEPGRCRCIGFSIVERLVRESDGSSCIRNH